MQAHRARLLAAAAALLLFLPAAAQAPKKFSWHEDTATLGFRIQRPVGWDEIPPTPGEAQMVMKYAPPGQWEISVGPEDELYLYGWLVKFDRRPDAEGNRPTPPFKDVHEWIKGTRDTGATGWSLVETQDLPAVKVPARAYLFEGPNWRGPNHPLVRCYAAVYTLSRDLELAMVYNGPPAESWRKYGQAFEKMARSWYNEGTGDYFSGFDYKRKKFIEGKSQIRERNVQPLIRDGRYVPMQEFVRWTQSEYYGENDFDLDILEAYAQGWSLIWFLRTGGKNKAPGWNDAWGSILGAYLDTLVATGDLDQAVDKAFAGVDWAAFEASWKAYIE